MNALSHHHGSPQGPYSAPGPSLPYPHMAYPAHPQPYAMQARAPQRNVALLVVGALLFVVALGAGALFAYNLYQYSTAAEHFASLPRYSQRFAIRIAESAAMGRMKLFGPVSAFFGIAGLVSFGLGLRKK